MSAWVYWTLFALAFVLWLAGIVWIDGWLEERRDRRDRDAWESMWR
jgi:hypothetical protein